jgi:hypothetical protein
MTWLPTTVLAVMVFVAMVGGSIFYGASRWQSGTGELRARLQVARVPITAPTYDAREIEGLPPSVQRYFRSVLRDGQPIIAAALLTHVGSFNMGESKANWRPFTSSQQVVTRRPGFDWDARIAMAPGLDAFVHDAYVAGEGILHAELLGLFRLADLRGTPEMAQGELMRYLAEAMWFPTALLPSQGVRWEAVDESSARATLTDGATTASLVFAFGKDGLIDGMSAAARMRTVNGQQVATPWRGRGWAYEVRDGMRIPIEGEVAWQLPEGPWPYWRARITSVTFEWAQSQ